MSDEERDQSIDQHLRDAILADPVDTASLDARVRQKIAQSGERSVAEPGNPRSALADRNAIRRGKWVAVASIAALIAIAVGGYQFLADRDAALCTDAAADHRTEVVEHKTRRWSTDQASIDQLAARQGLGNVNPASFAPAGYHFTGARLCLLNHRVFLHLVYSDGARQFSFYLRDRGSKSGVPALASNVVDRGDEHVATVASARYTAIVVSDESGAAARTLANFESTVL